MICFQFAQEKPSQSKQAVLMICCSRLLAVRNKHAKDTGNLSFPSAFARPSGTAEVIVRASSVLRFIFIFRALPALLGCPTWLHYPVRQRDRLASLRASPRTKGLSVRPGLCDATPSFLENLHPLLLPLSPPATSTLPTYLTRHCAVASDVVVQTTTNPLAFSVAAGPQH